MNIDEDDESIIFVEQTNNAACPIAHITRKRLKNYVITRNVICIRQHNFKTGKIDTYFVKYEDNKNQLKKMENW